MGFFIFWVLVIFVCFYVLRRFAKSQKTNSPLSLGNFQNEDNDISSTANNDLLPCNKTLFIKYKSAGGEVTERTVLVSKFNNDYFFGFCEMRGDFRTFRYDRIKRCVDKDTGEVIRDLRGLLYNEFNKSPEAAIMKMVNKIEPIICVLFAFARVDGRISPKEKEQIVDWIASIDNIDKQYLYLIYDQTKKIEPLGSISLRFYFKELAKRLDENSKKTIFDKCSQIILADNKIKGEEIELLDSLRLAFNINIENIPENLRQIR